ncbi:MAG TPA: hypothetical protein VJK51_02145 [Candidatus Nanoarchaeia archaeon]|nr:hypothetical protein [Candidatus Nanoarchaeia archaeon]
MGVRSLIERVSAYIPIALIVGSSFIGGAIGGRMAYHDNYYSSRSPFSRSAYYVPFVLGGMLAGGSMGVVVGGGVVLGKAYFEKGSNTPKQDQA